MSPRTKEIIDPSHPLLQANRDAVESIKPETFAYSSTDRHKLDIYYPPLGVEHRMPSVKPTHFPILIFFYGGGLVRGERSSPPHHLVYNNLGAFFASRGFIAVIPDYRLAPGITFPEGSQDARDAIEWVVCNVPQGDPSHLFIFGHSAGGLHVAGLLLTPDLLSIVEGHLRGVILMGVPFQISPERGEFYAVAKAYYGEIATQEPLGLLHQADAAYIGRLPPLYNLRSASEPRQIARGIGAFTKAVKAKAGSIVEVVLQGHDHMSPVLALSSGSGEEWAEDAIVWMQSTAEGEGGGQGKDDEQVLYA